MPRGAWPAALKADGHAVDGFVVQAMVPEGVELLVGVTSDPRFGPVVACGAGGVTAELLADVAVRLAPVDAREAERDDPRPADVPAARRVPRSATRRRPAVAEVVVRTSGLAVAHPAVVELDLNPVIASPAGAVVVDARIRIEAPPPDAPFPAVGV